MKYKCSMCNYETNNKSNFNKHTKSITHVKNNSKCVPKTIKLDEEPKEYKDHFCQCGKSFTHASSLSRHKLHYCPDKVQELQGQVEILSNKVENYESLLAKYEKLVESVGNKGISNSNTTYNISVKNYIQQKYPNAPALKGIDDYSLLVYKDYKLMDTLVYNYDNNNLHKYLGNFIIAYYKKDDPSKQAMFTTDPSRLTYIISELLANKKSVWNHDYKGTKIKEYILMPLLGYIRECIDEFFGSIEIKKSKINDISDIESQFGYRRTVAKIAEVIDNNILIDDILKYIAPYFCIDREKDKEDKEDKKNIDENEDIKQLEYFVDQ